MVQNEQNTADREIVITRIVNAPQALVYSVWTDPEHIAQWWGPNGFTITTHEISIKPGGVWRFIMHGPDGTNYDNRITFGEMNQPHGLTYACDSDIDNDPGAFRSKITFEAVDGNKTRITMRAVFASADVRNMVVEKYHAVEGGNQTLSRFEGQLAKATEEMELILTREFNAPRELVFKAWTEADRLAEWWGPVGFKMEHIDLDLRPGGRFHYSMKNDSGFEMWGLFTYREVNAPEHIVFINSFSDKDGNKVRGPFFDGKWPLEIMNELTLTEHNGTTTLTLKGMPVNATIEEMQLFLANRSSMQQGFKGTFDQLEQYLATHHKQQLP